MLAHVPSFGRNPRGSPDFLAYPVPKACMHVLGTGVPRRLSVARSASCPKAAQALGCSLTPGLRISFGRVTCMAQAASVSGLWTLGFVLLRGACVWVWVVLGLGCRLRPATPGRGLGLVCLGTGRGFALRFPAGVCGVCGWARVSAHLPPFLVGVLGRAWLCARSACTPPFPARVCGVGGCAWARVSAAPRHSWARCCGVCVFVCAPCPVPCTPWPAGGAVRGCVLGPGLLPRPATPGWGVGACVCLCARPACTPSFLAGVCGVGVCVGLGFRLCPATLGVGVCVRSSVCPVCTPPFLAGWRVCVWAWISSALRFFPGLGAGVRGLLCALRSFPFPFWGAACGVAVCGCCCGWGFLPPPSPLVSFFSCGGGCRGVSCRGFVLSVAGCPRLGSRAHRPPFPSRTGCAFLCFFFPSLPYRGVCRRVRGVLSSGWAAALGWVSPVLAGWSSGVPSGGPVFGAVWLGGLAASCGWAVSLLWAFLVPPPPCFFFGRVCLFLPLPSLGWCTHWSAFSVVNRVAIGACVLLGLAPAPWVGWVMCTLRSVALLAGLSSGSAGWAVALGGFVRPWVRKAGVSRVSPPPRCRN